MQNNKIINALSNLMRSKHDIIMTYEQALENIDMAGLHEHINLFLNEHKYYTEETKKIIASLSDHLPNVMQEIEKVQELKGIYHSELFSTTRYPLKVEETLQSLLSNEKKLQESYLSTLACEIPLEIQAKIEDAFKAEKKHLHFLEKILENKPWEKEKAPTG